MATYIQCKSGAFRRVEDIIPLGEKRSEGRLKRYNSATDLRVWANNAHENKKFIFQLMGCEPPPTKKRKVMGQIVPIDTVWKVLMTTKNDYISDLENRIQSFVDLIQTINLTQTQVKKISQLCSTTFLSISDHLLKTKLPEGHHVDSEKSIQASPSTKSSVIGTSVLTTNAGMKTLSIQLNDCITMTDIKGYKDSFNDALVRSVCDVCLQVYMPLPMADKSVSVRVRSSQLLRNKSLTEKTTEVSKGRLEMAECAPIRRKSTMSKSQSAFVCTTDTSADAIPKPRKSCVSFSKKIDSFPIFEQEPSAENIGEPAKPKKAFGSRDSIDPMEIIGDIIGQTKADSSVDTIDVISECEQTSFCERKYRPSVIQLYRSPKKSSIESTLVQQASEFALEGGAEAESKNQEEYETDHSTADVAVSNININAGITSEGKKVSVAATTMPSDPDKQCVECLECHGKTSDKTNKDDSDNDDHFEDCRPPSAPVEKRDQESHIVSCVSKKTEGKRTEMDKVDPDEDCPTLLKRAEEELGNHRILAQCAVEQLQIVRQTLQDNNITITQIDLDRISKVLKASKLESLSFDGCLYQGCGFPAEPTFVLGELLLLIEQFCNTITTSINRFESMTGDKLTQPTSSLPNVPATASSSDPKKLKQQLEHCKCKMIKLEQASLERDKLQHCVCKLEEDLRIYEKIKFELVSDPEVAKLLDANDVFKEVCQLKRQAEQCDQLELQLICEKTCVVALKENLSDMSANRYNEYESLRSKAQEADIVRLELDRLRLEVSDVQKIRTENINLHNKIVQLEQCVCCPQHKQGQNILNTNAALLAENNVEHAQQQAEEIEKLKKEKQALLCTIVMKECELVDQEDQIERLVNHIDRISSCYEEQQEKSKLIVAQLRSDLAVKTNYISKLDNNLECVEEKLKKSISHISKDCSQCQNKLKQLEQTCCQYKAKNDSMQDTINCLQKRIAEQEETNKKYSIELQKKDKLMDELKKARPCDIELNQKAIRMDRMECILKKSHNAVRRVVEELAKQYRCELMDIQKVVPDFVNN